MNTIEEFKALADEKEKIRKEEDTINVKLKNAVLSLVGSEEFKEYLSVSKNLSEKSLKEKELKGLSDRETQAFCKYLIISLGVKSNTPIKIEIKKENEHTFSMVIKREGIFVKYYNYYHNHKKVTQFYDLSHHFKELNEKGHKEELIKAIVSLVKEEEKQNVSKILEDIFVLSEIKEEHSYETDKTIPVNKEYYGEKITEIVVRKSRITIPYKNYHTEDYKYENELKDMDVYIDTDIACALAFMDNKDKIIEKMKETEKEIDINIEKFEKNKANINEVLKPYLALMEI